MMGIFSKKQPKITADTPQGNGAAIRERFANTILDIVEDGAAIVNAKGELLYMNVAAAHELGYNNPSELLGANFLDILKMENSQGVLLTTEQNPLIQAFRKGEPWHSREYVVVNAQGERIPEMITMRPIDDAKTEFVAIFHDISESLEEESEQAEFISTASHEMRTPVASIEGYLGLALNPATATIDDRARKYLSEAHAASQHLGRLFRDLLDVTNLDDRRLKVQLVPSNVTELVKSYVTAHENASQAKKMQLSFGDGMTNAKVEQATYAMVDPGFLREIIDNLVENAIKYTPDGGSIWVNVTGNNDRVIINVTDTGMGIAPDDLDHIFQKFYRVDNSQTRTIGGTGLGLYLVKQRVEAMNGRVWAESTVSQGSTFYISLPRLTNDEYERQRMVLANSQAMMPSRPEVPELGTQTILAAEPMAEVSPAAEPAATVATDTAPETEPTGSVNDLDAETLSELKKKFAAQMAAGNSK